MSDTPFIPDARTERTTPADETAAPQSNGSGGWLPRWTRPGADRPQQPDEPQDAPAPFAAPQAPPPVDAGQAAPKQLETSGSTTHLHGDVDVVAGVIERLILQTRTQDVLAGIKISRARLLERPFVRDPHWKTAWEEAVDAATGRPRQPVLIIVAPRACGSTTFALRLLAEHTADHIAVVQLDADWNAPKQSRLPLEKGHAFQLDLKHPENDQLSTEFLDALSKHSANLRDCRSYLVLTVAQELWQDHRLGDRDGVHVVHLRGAPDAQEVVEAQLETNGYNQLVTVLKSFTKAQASLRGLTAVAAVRAARTIVMASQEHTRLQQASVRTGSGDMPEMSLEARVTAALTDWRGELDGLFGELTSLHSHGNTSLTVEDRCLLLALAVRQSAPMPEVAHSASSLLKIIGHVPATSDGAAASHALAGRGVRRRIQDVGASVDTQDTVVFDRPAYGRAVLEYVWDNYDTLREPLLTWLVQTAQSTGPEDRAVEALAELTVRHGTMDYLTLLGKSAGPSKPEVLGAVMASAVHNEHIGRLAWEALYRWAEQDDYAPAVITLCQRILEDSSVTTAMAKRAMVRLRRVAHKSEVPAHRSRVLAAFTQIAQQSTGAAYLADEVRHWQQGKSSTRGGSLAFLALMAATADGTPLLLGETWPDIDVRKAVQDLLSDAETAAEIIPRLTDWIRACATDHTTYEQLRDQLLPALRGHNMFEAGMNLMQQLRGISTTDGVSVADDFYHHLVDPRVQHVFPLPGGAA